jgi:glycosyltransferase involved in cell wall biosynthesis
MTPTAKGIGLYKDFPVILLAKCFKVQIVYHFHNKGVSEKQNQLCDHYAYKWMFKNAKVILLSKYLYDDIKKYVSPVRVFYCPNGIPDHGIENINLKKTKKKKVQILFLSNLMESKGVFVLLEACKILNQKQIPFHCTFVGGEGDISVKQLQNIVNRQELTEHVVYVGKKYGNAKNTEFEKADIFVLPTYNETFGLVNLEAMHFALPVVSTYEGGIRDVVEEGITGFLVPQKDAQALADKLEVLIKNPQLRTDMGHAGRVRYEKYYTLEHFENNFVHCLRQIL